MTDHVPVSVLARSRADTLLEATVAISRAESAADIASATSLGLLTLLRGDSAAVYECVERGGEKGLALIRESGFRPETARHFGWIPLRSAIPVAAVARSGEAELLTNREQFVKAYPHLAAMLEQAERSALATFPLRIGARVTGALLVAFAEPRSLSCDDVAFTSILAEQCALALERARLFNEEHAARCRAEALQRLALALSTVETPEAVASEAVQLGMQLTHTTHGVLSLLSADRQTFNVVAAPNSSQRMLDEWRSYANAGEIPAAIAVRTGQPCYSRTRAEYVARGPGLARIAEEVGLQAEAVLPLKLGDHVIGVLSFAFPEAREFGGADDAFLRAVAELTAQALERTRLLASERAAREEAERVGFDRARDAEELEQLYQSSPLGLAFLDCELRYQRLNGVLAKLNGQSLEWHLGRTLGEVLPAEAHVLEPRMRDVLAGQSIVDFELTGGVANAPGEQRSTISSFLPVRDRDGRVKGINVIVQDITQRKRAELQAQASEAALQEAHLRKDEFLATLAHELRNPLAPIRNALEILQLPLAQEIDVTRARGVIGRQIDQMTRLVDDLLDVSRISQGRLELKREPVDLRAVLSLAVETSRPLLQEFRHRLRVELPHDALPVFADQTRLGQVFANLLNNAAKYMPPGGDVQLRVERRFDQVLVSVRDHGIGIDTGDLPHVFEMFSQVGAARRHARGGLGIGLSLVRRLTDMHGGRVSVESANGLGSTFTVELPMHVSMGANAAPAQERAPDTSPSRRVLLVDDNTDAAETLAILLEAVGHAVTVAHTGHEAIAVAQSLVPEVVLLDIGLPDISGLEVCRTLRETEATRSAFIVALTGWGQAEDRRQTSEAQFDLHLVKPVHPNEIRKLLDGERLGTAPKG